MKVLRLARIAAEAETLRLRQISRRSAFRVAYAAVGCIFLVAALATGHLAAWLALAPRVGALYAALILLGVDLFIALVLLVLAARGGDDRIAAEALQIRQAATRQIAQSVAQSVSLFILLRPLANRARSKGGTLGRFAAGVLDGFLRR